MQNKKITAKLQKNLPDSHPEGKLQNDPTIQPSVSTSWLTPPHWNPEDATNDGGIRGWLEDCRVTKIWWKGGWENILYSNLLQTFMPQARELCSSTIFFNRRQLPSGRPDSSALIGSPHHHHHHHHPPPHHHSPKL